MDALIASHKKEYDIKPEIIVSAPGIVNLLGEHTDYYNGCTIQTAIDSYVLLAMSARADNSLRFYSTDLEERKRTTISNLKYKKEDRWANYIKGVISQIQQSGSKLSGLDITLKGSIPQGIGLGSSAAIGVAAAAAIKNFFNLDLSDIQLVNCVSSSENMFLGLDSQITDPFTSYNGVKDQGIFLDLLSLDFSYVPLKFEGINLVVTNSNVPIVSTSDELRERKAGCEKFVSYLRKKRPGSSLRDYSINDLKHGIDLVSESVRRLCMHVVQENEMTISGKAALLKKDAVAFGKIMTRSHESLRDYYEVSCPEIDWLVKRACEIPGVLGSRMTGTGFGGCTVSLMKESALPEYQKRLDEYDHIFGFTPKYHIFKPSDGIRVIYP